MSQLKTSVTQALPHYPSPWGLLLLISCYECTIYSMPSAVHVSYQGVLNMPCPAIPFVPSQYFLFMPVPAWEAFPSLSSSSALWARYLPLCSYHSLYIDLFQHCCLGPTWNILHFIPYKPVHFLKQLVITDSVPRTMPGIDQMFSVCLRRWASTKPCSVT